jgi:ferredoxin--NADP+ reductase
MVDVKASVAVIGAGPAGLFAARELANNGFNVVLFNRNIKPGGLAEYGIYPEKYRIKDGLRAQFKAILDCENISYFGNVSIGEEFPLNLGDLKQMGFAAVLVTCGAQGTKWLGLPGEDLTGVYHAKTLVYHYNHLPPFSTQKLEIGRKVFVVGVGNVMTDIVRFLTGLPQVEEITTIARRGPAEVKFDKRELDHIAPYMIAEEFEKEMQRVTPFMQAVGQNPDEAAQMIRDSLAAVNEPEPRPKWNVRFLYSPTQMLSNDGKVVSGLMMEENKLELRNGDTKARGTGTTVEVEADTVIFAIGDCVNDDLGIPLKGSEFAISAAPKYPIDGNSYELVDEKSPERFDGVFVGGWSRNASAGMVGITRKDGANAAKAVMQYIEDHPTSKVIPGTEMKAELAKRGYKAVTVDSLEKLEAEEKKQAQEKGLPEFKFNSDDEMLKVMGLA